MLLSQFSSSPSRHGSWWQLRAPIGQAPYFVVMIKWMSLDRFGVCNAVIFCIFFQTLDSVRLCHVESGLIYCRVETWPARSLLEALQQEEASILFSLRGKKQNFTGTKCLVGRCVSNTKRRKRREPSANFYVPKIFCMQRMQCILAEIWTQGTKSPRSWGNKCCQSSLRKHRGHSSNMHSRHRHHTDSQVFSQFYVDPITRACW